MTEALSVKNGWSLLDFFAKLDGAVETLFAKPGMTVTANTSGTSPVLEAAAWTVQANTGGRFVKLFRWRTRLGRRLFQAFDVPVKIIWLVAEQLDARFPSKRARTSNPDGRKPGRSEFKRGGESYFARFDVTSLCEGNTTRRTYSGSLWPPLQELAGGAWLRALPPQQRDCRLLLADARTACWRSDAGPGFTLHIRAGAALAQLGKASVPTET